MNTIINTIMNTIWIEFDDEFYTQYKRFESRLLNHGFWFKEVNTIKTNDYRIYQTHYIKNNTVVILTYWLYYHNQGYICIDDEYR